MPGPLIVGRSGWLGALLALAFALSLPGATRADEARSPELEAAIIALEAGDIATAEDAVETARARATTPEERWDVDEVQAALLHWQDRDAEALAILVPLLDSARGLFPPDSLRPLYAERMLAATQSNLGDEAAATRTLLGSLRRFRAQEQPDIDTLLLVQSDLVRLFLDQGDLAAAAMLAAEMRVQAANEGDVPRAEAQEAALLQALATLRLGYPAQAAQQALPVWRLGTPEDPVVAEVAGWLDDEFGIEAETRAGPDGDAEAVLQDWIDTALSLEARSDATLPATLAGIDRVMAALEAGSPVEADRAGRAAFDRQSAQDPLVAAAYFALMTMTYNADRRDLSATWALRLAEMPAGYLASLGQDPVVLFREIGNDMIDQGRTGDAITLGRAAVEQASIREEADAETLQRSLTLLGAALRDAGRQDEAERVLLRAADIGLSRSSPSLDEARSTLQALMDLGLLHLDAGRPEQAGQVFDQAVTLLQSGPVGAEAVGWTYMLQGYLPLLAKTGAADRGLALARQALAVAEADTRAGAKDDVEALRLLTQAARLAGERDLAADSATRALAKARTLGLPAPEIAWLAIQAAAAERERGQIEIARSILAQAVDGMGGGAGAEAGLLVGLAVEQSQAGDPEGARRLVQLAGEGLAPDVPILPYLWAIEGGILLQQDRPAPALEVLRRATAALTQPERRAEPRARDHLPLHVSAALDLAEEEDGTELVDEAFRVAQRVGDLSAGAALGRAIARLRGGDAASADLARRMEAAEGQLAVAQQTLIDALDGAAPVPAARAELAAARAAQEAAAAELALSFPEYAAFADPRPIALQRVAALLGPEEVLVLYATSDMGGLGGSSPSQAFAVTRDRVLTADLPPRSEIEPLVHALRCAAALTDRRCGLAVAGSAEGDMRGAFSLAEAGAAPRYQGFDTDLAHRAYQMLLEPLAPALEGKTTLIVVPDKALAGLPFQVLTTAPSAPEAAPATVPWLIRDMALTVSPSVASLVALRELPARPATESLPFLGIGDPLIGAQVAGALPIDCATTSAAGLQASALAPATGPVLRSAKGANMELATLAALPDTRCELEATAAYFGPGSALRLGAEATEGDLRQMSEAGELARYRVISFATHGLVAGEIGTNPAGLVLTPVPGAGADEDGLLTTEDIAALRLDAEFVLLSACNTAAATREGEDALSGLASAFFLAGARTLLVSHWPVYSDAATDLTTGIFEAMAADPGIGRSEALRRAMLNILDDPQATPRQRHPAYWAPFALAGQG